MNAKTVHLLYGRDGMEISVPETADVLVGQDVPAIARADEAVAAALAAPIGSAPLAELVARKRPRSVAITISDITRPVPNKQFLPAMLKVLNDCGVADAQIVIIIGTGMHRPSTAEEREILVGADIERRIEVIDHRAADAETLVRVSDGSTALTAGGSTGLTAGQPLVSVCRRFAEADLRIVTGYIEAHFMAGFSGGRKGVCPALVDLETVQRFHGFDTLADPRADNGILEGNPCHEIALKVARTVGVDFLFNVAITKDRRIAGIYCGDLVEAHLAGCGRVAEWTTADIDGPYDLVVTNAGGFPLDQTFYQTVKGMCTALPALGPASTLLQVSGCGEQLGSPTFTELMRRWRGDWRAFLAHTEANKDRTELDQWEFQMQARVLSLIGVEKLWFVSDGIDADMQRIIGVTPVPGDGDARQRAQRAIDEYVGAHGGARIAVIPEGPYTMLRRR